MDAAEAHNISYKANRPSGNVLIRRCASRTVARLRYTGPLERFNIFFQYLEVSPISNKYSNL